MQLLKEKQLVCNLIDLRIKYEDGYTCMLDGYTKSYDKILELGREDVNKFNIYIKFGCYENQSNKTPISNKFIK